MLGLTLASKKLRIDWVLAGQWERLSGGLVVKGLCPCVDSGHIPVDQIESLSLMSKWRANSPHSPWTA